MGDIDARQVWFVTGAATGLGLAIAEHALASGHCVVATARGADRLASLVARDPERVLACGLDVTSRADIETAVAAATARFGRIDVLVNNAAGGLMGAVEESSDAEVRTIMESNFFGVWELIRVILPQMRARRSGTIVNVSSFAALCGFTGLGAYAASKWALEGMSEALASEVASFGIRVIIAEPGGLQTEFAARSIRFTEANPAYEPVLGEMRNRLRQGVGKGLGDPEICAQVIAMAIAADEPPLRLVLGKDAIGTARFSSQRLADDLERWEQAGASITPA